MNIFRIQMDVYMIMNVFETNTQEATDLISSELILYILMMGIVPSLLVAGKVKIKSDVKDLLNNFKLGLASLITMILILIPSLYFKNSFRFLKAENRYTLNYLLPANYIGNLIRFTSIKIRSKIFVKKIIKISEDAKIKDIVHKNGNKNLILIVIGESARSQNFSLNGYRKDTNKPLDKFNVISYKNVYSCGTFTVHSIPCIFSHMDKKNFDLLESSKYENIIDIFKNLGFDVKWRSNNGDCKGVCNRIKFLSTNGLDGFGFDESLIVALNKDLKQLKEQNTIIILNQRGSHDPLYKRYPTEFERYKPVCRKGFSNCSTLELINAYDNTIYYTSHNLSKMLSILRDKMKDYNTMLLYVSDHGDGLGENNVWSHGMPYEQAGEYVTKVPMLLWFSEGFREEFRINEECLRSVVAKKLSHDNIFHSLLGLFWIESSYYNENLDIFKNCRKQ
jgi:lipid A ethanolaminephosphotransferase